MVDIYLYNDMNYLSNFIPSFTECEHSTTLLIKLIDLNKKLKTKINLTDIEKAIYYAKIFYKDDNKISVSERFTQVINTTSIVCDYCTRTDLITASILQFLVQDEKLSLDVIEDAFNPLIARHAFDLTYVRSNESHASMQQILESLIAQQKYELLLIKLFEGISNLQSLINRPNANSDNLISETLETFIALATYLEIPDVKRKTLELCFKNLGIKSSPKQILDLAFEDDYQPLAPIFQNVIAQIKIQH